MALKLFSRTKMMSISAVSLGMVLLLGLFLAACSDNPTDPDPETNPVNSVEIDPAAVSFNAIGQTRQFTAKAFDINGGTVSTTFSWSSSDEQVVVISSGGRAEAAGPGNASIFVTAGGKADTSQVTVELPDDPTVSWISATSGEWSDPAKWSTGIVPQPDDTVAIPLDGTYTVTLTEDVTIKHIVLGAAEGTQTLATATHRFTTENGKLTGGAELQIDGSAVISGEFRWQQGEITGSGTVEVESGAEVQAGGGSNVRLKATLINKGVFAIVSGITIKIDGGTLENESGALLDFQSDVSLSAFSGGSIKNSGDLVKSAGNGEAFISVSSPETFVNSGYVGVERGILNIRDGELDGVIDIEADAELRQSGITLIRQPLLNTGEGIFEIGGRIILGEQAGEIIRLRHVVLESILSNGISGPGDLRIDGSLLWRKGNMSAPGQVIVGGLANAKIEGSGFKNISERILVVAGSLETESLLDLRLSEGAQIHIDNFSDWTHTGGGTIRKGSGAAPAVIVTETFRKKGTGSLTVEADFICAGEMFLDEGALSVKGNFDLQENGKIVGGGTNTDNELNYRRLQVPEAPSAVLAGTIDVDADGELAYMSTLGAVTIMPTFNVLCGARWGSFGMMKRINIK